ncbi:unnamed protein product [Symbiodinium sp. CCMP2592]|nr:unnamed protein product [Symbiodinium sp. CCMP2592]
MASQAFIDDQELLKSVIAIGWAEDDCQGFKIIRIRMVTKDLQVVTRLFDLSRSAHKKAVQKVEHAKAAIHQVFPEPELEKRFCNLVKVFTTDGEPAELAAAAISHPTIFPQLRAVWRCLLHSAQRSQENAIKSCDRAAHLMSELINRFSDSSGAGGLARALHNSPLLRSKFQAVEARDLDALGTLASPGAHAAWAARLLDEVSQIAFMSRGVRLLKQELAKLFEFSGPNSSTPPLVLDLERYSSGFVALLQKALVKRDPTGSCAIVGDGELLFHRAGLSAREFKQAVVKQLGCIRNLTDVFLRSIAAEHQAGIGECFGALDIEKGAAARHQQFLVQYACDQGEDSFICLRCGGLLCLNPSRNYSDLLPRPECITLQRVSKDDNASVKGSELAKEINAVRSGISSPLEYWAEALKHWGKRVPVLREAVVVMLCMFEGTGLLEQNLSSFRAMHHDQKRNTSPDTLRCLLKVMVDCDPVVTFNILTKEYKLTDFGIRAYNRYRSLFGAARNAPASLLPRRTMNRRCSSTGLAALKRLQAQQKADAVPKELPLEEAKSLKRALDTSAEEHSTKRQKKMVVALAERVTAKLALVSPATFAKDARERLQKLQLQDEEEFKKLDGMQLRELKTAEILGDAQNGLAVCIISKNEIPNADKIVKDKAKALSQLCGLRVCHLTSSSLVARCLRAKFVIFLATSKEAEAGLIYHGSESHQGLDLGACVSRLVGGFVAGPAWMAECLRRGQLLTPLLRLSPAAKIQRQGWDSVTVCHNKLQFSSYFLLLRAMNWDFGTGSFDPAEKR